MIRRHIVRMILGGLFSVLGVGCDKAISNAPVQPPRFPVLVVWPGVSLLVHRDDAELHRLHVNYLNNPHRPVPILIDADLRQFRMADLHSTNGSMWLMLNPSGTANVEFKLEPIGPAGLAAARVLIAGCEFLGRPGDDHDAIRRDIESADGMDAFIAALEAERPTTRDVESD